MLTVRAPAKLNPVLEVLGRRDDGYHEIKSILQSVSLFDELSLEESRRIEFTCSVKELETRDNLAFKAAVALKEASGHKGGARIHLEKKIPRGMGLGGGSSDAAAVLKGLNGLWSLGLPEQRLAEIGAGIGSDVPYFIFGGTCVAGGRGEKVTPLADAEREWFVILVPGIEVRGGKTGRLYGLLESRNFTDGRYVKQALADLNRSKRIEPGHLYNVFEGVSSRAFTGLEAFSRALAEAGARHVHLAGSGPALYAPAHDEKEALHIRDRLAEVGIHVMAASTLSRSEIAER